MALLFGCMYVVRFGSMKRTHQALSWAEVCFGFLINWPPLRVSRSGNKEDQYINMVECVGTSCDARYLVILVRLMLSTTRCSPSNITVMLPLSGPSFCSPSAFSPLSGAQDPPDRLPTLAPFPPSPHAVH